MHTAVMHQEEKQRKIELAEGFFQWESSDMCDYSLQGIKSRPAKVDDKLTTRSFGTGTRGFAGSENPSVAVCVLPGTELAFAHEVKRLPSRLWPWPDGIIRHKTAIFRQINKEKVAAHHDALEFPDGQTLLLTFLCEGQEATVLQLPAESKTAVETEARHCSCRNERVVRVRRSVIVALPPPGSSANGYGWNVASRAKRMGANGRFAKSADESARRTSAQLFRSRRGKRR